MLKEAGKVAHAWIKAHAFQVRFTIIDRLEAHGNG
jgi:hypothetical protein